MGRDRWEHDAVHRSRHEAHPLDERVGELVGDHGELVEAVDRTAMGVPVVSVEHDGDKAVIVGLIEVLGAGLPSYPSGVK